MSRVAKSITKETERLHLLKSRADATSTAREAVGEAHQTLGYRRGGLQMNTQGKQGTTKETRSKWNTQLRSKLYTTRRGLIIIDTDRRWPHQREPVAQRASDKLWNHFVLVHLIGSASRGDQRWTFCVALGRLEGEEMSRETTVQRDS